VTSSKHSHHHPGHSIAHQLKHRRIVLWAGGGLLATAMLSLGALLIVKEQQDQNAILSALNGGPVEKFVPTPTPSPTPEPTPTVVRSALNGQMISPDQAAQRPVAIMIENHPDARPQAGLAGAPLVYETEAEGGITRFMAVYDGSTGDITAGPVRSARTYFVDYVEELEALYGHVGGNIDALQQIAANRILDLDQSRVGAAAYWRETSRRVATEHTMFL